MKKSIFVLALSMSILTVHAQNDRTALEGTRPGDNWSIELKAGAVTPLTHSSFLKNARPAFGFGIGKQLTPIFGLGIQWRTTLQDEIYKNLSESIDESEAFSKY